jgi:hypothetical protein
MSDAEEPESEDLIKPSDSVPRHDFAAYLGPDSVGPPEAGE